MLTTSVSLLERVRAADERAAWDRFVELYMPLLYSWAGRLGLGPDDAADLVQDVFATLVQKMPEFRYDARRSFRAWLRAVTCNRYRDFRRRAAARPQAAAAMPDVPDPATPDPFWERDYRTYVVGRALELMQAEFQPTTWRACWECVAGGRPAAEVARELGLSVASVYAAKSRVLRRLRQELGGLLD